jgi:predicted nucleic acid-binding protein
VICLDTDYLILGLAEGSDEGARLVEWYRGGEHLMTSAVCWYEFACGPVNAEQTTVIRSFLAEGIAPFDESHAAEAARLWNAVGRVRRLRVDAMIAASAILAGARLATSNRDDFEVFRPFGLGLV